MKFARPVGTTPFGKRGAVAAVLIVGILLGSLTTQPAAAYEFDLADNLADYSGLIAYITYSDNGVNVRSEPSIDSEVVTRVPEGARVELRVDNVHTVYDEDGDRWWPVIANGVEGWVIGFYLADDGVSLDTQSSVDVTPGLESGSIAEVVTDDGGSLRMRIGAGVRYEAIGSLPFGDVVEIVSGPYYDADGDGWYLINDGDKRAFVIGAFLESAGTAPVTNGEFSRGDFASADGELNVRAGPSIDDGVVGELAGGTLVEIIGGPYLDEDGDGWYLVESDDLEGYAIANFLLSAETPDTGPVTGSFIYPLANYRFTQAYGCSPFAIEPWDANLGCNYHNGIDLAASAYTPIRAADGGTVKNAGWCNCGLGYFVEIDHGNGLTTIYGHMAESPYVSKGDVVNQGDVIGPVGSTGISTGPHVHFMVAVNNVPMNPADYL